MTAITTETVSDMPRPRLARPRGSTRRSLAALGLSAITGFAGLAATGCGDDQAAAPQAAAPIEPAKDAIAKTTELGPVKATIKVWPAKPALGDPVYAQLEIDAPAGIAIDAPFQEAGAQLGRFGVIAFSRDTQHKPDGGQHQVQRYTLEPATSGRQRIPPLRLEFSDTRSAAGSASKAAQELLTDEVPIEIAPIPSEAASSALRPAAGEIDPDVGGVSWFTILGLGFGAAVLGSGSVLGYRALRARRRIALQRSAYDEAVAELRALEAKGPPDAALADSWFVALSTIVRRYLEQRYEIRAPELTTEEFLLVATARPELSAEHRALLSSFLERCDRVKFAGYRPEADESLASLAAARGFVEDTRVREPIATAVAMPQTSSSGKAA
jgi:hypothetical protein